MSNRTSNPSAMCLCRPLNQKSRREKNRNPSPSRNPSPGTPSIPKITNKETIITLNDSQWAAPKSANSAEVNGHLV
jgi:hypothetical protein